MPLGGCFFSFSNDNFKANTLFLLILAGFVLSYLGLCLEKKLTNAERIVKKSIIRASSITVELKPRITNQGTTVPQLAILGLRYAVFQSGSRPKDATQ